jgi:hypothetical protein
LVTLAEAAEIAGVSARYLRRLARRQAGGGGLVRGRVGGIGCWR